MQDDRGTEAMDLATFTALSDNGAEWQRLQRAEARIAGFDAMGAALAHELNQPLTALLLYLQAIKRAGTKPEHALPPLMVELQEKALREAERASEIVRRMRRMTARSEPERNAFHFRDVLQESVEVAFAGVKRLPKLEENHTEEPTLLSGDRVQIGQVLVNLLRNAVEATSSRSRPRIALSTALIRDEFIFKIADNGPGVDPKIATRLFKAFETDKPHGLGLGLAISRMIAQNHGGDLALQPGDIGNGATFILRLPMR